MISKIKVTKFLVLPLVCVLVLSFGVNTETYANDVRESITIDTFTSFTQEELNSLSSKQIVEFTDYLSQLSEEELSDIGQEVWNKIIGLWQRDSEEQSKYELTKSLLDTEQKPIELDPPGIRYDQSFSSANWGQNGGGGSGIHEWDSSYSTSSNRNNVQVEATAVGYGYANAATGIMISTDAWQANEAHEVDITFEGWTGWWMTTLGQDGAGSFDVDAYVYDLTNERYVGSTSIYSSDATILWWDTEDFAESIYTTLWGDRTYAIFINSHILATAYWLDFPGYCQCESDTSSYHTNWGTNGFDWLNQIKELTSDMQFYTF